MKLETVAQAKTAAVRDARLFAREFPGERVSGDWDAEAFSFYQRPTGQRQYDAVWNAYRKTLHAEVERRIK